MTDPTKEALVLQAVSVWRQGCGHGRAGECRECNDLLLADLRKHLDEKPITIEIVNRVQGAIAVDIARNKKPVAGAIAGRWGTGAARR